jgi:hypothetical protein
VLVVPVAPPAPVVLVVPVVPVAAFVALPPVAPPPPVTLAPPAPPMPEEVSVPAMPPLPTTTLPPTPAPVTLPAPALPPLPLPVPTLVVSGPPASVPEPPLPTTALSLSGPKISSYPIRPHDAIKQRINAIRAARKFCLDGHPFDTLLKEESGRTRVNLSLSVGEVLGDVCECRTHAAWRRDHEPLDAESACRRHTRLRHRRNVARRSEGTPLSTASGLRASIEAPSGNSPPSPGSDAREHGAVVHLLQVR